MPKFRIPVSFVFDGHFDVEARDKATAVDMVNNGCGMTMRLGVHSDLPDDQVDWEFSQHPEKRVHAPPAGAGDKAMLLTEDVLEADLVDFINTSDIDSLAELYGHVYGMDVTAEDVGGLCTTYRCVPIPGKYCDHRVDELKDVK